MRTALAVVCAVAIPLLFALPADGQARGTSTLVSRLVRAQCLSGGVPALCNASGITFRSGAVQIRRRRQSALVFNRRVGRVSLQSVAPPQMNLDARVSARVTYGPDSDADPCPFANTQVVVSPWATSTMTCFRSAELGYFMSCGGDLHLTTLTPASCANVSMTLEDVISEVYEAGFMGVPTRLIARDGQAVLGSFPDCDSGGIGCP